MLDRDAARFTRNSGEGAVPKVIHLQHKAEGDWHGHLVVKMIYNDGNPTTQSSSQLNSWTLGVMIGFSLRSGRAAG